MIRFGKYGNMEVKPLCFLFVGEGTTYKVNSIIIQPLDINETIENGRFPFKPVNSKRR